MTNSQSVQSNIDKLQNHFRNETELSDLHTHLLGMGDATFWVERILMKETVLPTNDEFLNNRTLRIQLCRLVWNPYEKEFLCGEAATSIFDELRNKNYPEGSRVELKNLIDRYLPKSTPTSNDRDHPNKLLEELMALLDYMSSKKSSYEAKLLNKLLEELENSIYFMLPKRTSDDTNSTVKSLKDFRKLINRILPKITLENTNFVKERLKKLSDLTNRMFPKPTLDDTNLLNKLLEEIKNLINCMLPKPASDDMDLLKKLLQEIKDSINRMFSKPTSDDPNVPNKALEKLEEDPINRKLHKPKPDDTNPLDAKWGEIGGLIGRMLFLLASEETKYLRKSFTDLNTLIYRVPPEEPVFYLMVECNNKFERELRNRGLTFEKDFSYDVILKLTDLASGLGVTNRCNEFIQAAVEEKLGFHIMPAFDRPQFSHWIVFNARTQYFEVVYGITVEKLRKLINDPDTPTEARQVARANIVNAFSMYDAEGTDARPIDIHNFQGMFTPEFYPRRFALKDSIYSQRLDVLAHLLDHVLYRYSTCRPPVTYCELSVGVGDLTRPWVFDVLCSIPSIPVKKTGEQSSTSSENKSSFRNLLLKEHFPSLQNAVIKNPESQEKSKSTESQQKLELQTPKCTYKFLAGFNRQQVQTSYFSNQQEAINLLNEAPQIAIHLMLNEISKSAHDEFITEKNDMFYRHIEQLGKVKESARNNSQFYHSVVGFDLFADEMGFPYCPFVARNFINYVLEIRKEVNPSFGLRIHCGENVPIADATAPAYRHFAAHMYIVFRCLRYLQYELEYGIRIGHGIAFQHILDRTMMNASEHRKSSVLIAEIEHHAREVFKTIAFEVNITSNEYLLGHAMRKGSPQQQPQLNAIRKGSSHQPLQLDALLKLKAPIILATDNDGIWPILKCPCHEPTHFSLSGECCRAISTKIINSLEELKLMFKNMKTFRFCTDDNKVIMPKADTSILPHDTRAFTIIIHPDIIKFIGRRCVNGEQQFGKFYKDFHRIFASEVITEKNNQDSSNKELTSWEKACYRLVPIAYVSYCAENPETHPFLKDEMKTQYKNIVENSDKLHKKIRDEYNKIFPEPPDVNEVLEEWKSVYQQLIEPNIIDQSQCVSTKSKKHVFFSEGPLTVHKDEERPMTDLINYLQRHYHYHYVEKLHIHAFTRHINIKATLEKIKEQLKRPFCNPNLYVSIYSTKDKDKYEDFDVSEKFQLKINHTPLQRTDFKDRSQQNGLYAVCPHASAATAFLHMIGKELSKESDIPLRIDESIKPSLHISQQLSLNNNTASVSSEQITVEVQSSTIETNTPFSFTTKDSYHDNGTPPSADINDDRDTVQDESSAEYKS